MKDAFGLTIEAGDYVLSSASSTGAVRTGVVYMVGTTPRLLIAWSNYRTSMRRVELGSSVVVLKRADSTVPAHLWPEVAAA